MATEIRTLYSIAALYEGFVRNALVSVYSESYEFRWLLLKSIEQYINF